MPMRFFAFDRKNPVEWTSVLELLGVGVGEVGRRRVAGEHRRRDLVDHLVGALGRQDRGDQELERRCRCTSAHRSRAVPGYSCGQPLDARRRHAPARRAAWPPGESSQRARAPAASPGRPGGWGSSPDSNRTHRRLDRPALAWTCDRGARAATRRARPDAGSSTRCADAAAAVDGHPPFGDARLARPRPSRADELGAPRGRRRLARRVPARRDRRRDGRARRSTLVAGRPPGAPGRRRRAALLERAVALLAGAPGDAPAGTPSSSGCSAPTTAPTRFARAAGFAARAGAVADPRPAAARGEPAPHWPDGMIGADVRTRARRRRVARGQQPGVRRRPRPGRLGRGDCCAAASPEPWFDPTGLPAGDRRPRPRRASAGRRSTRRTRRTSPAPLGEIYVIGVDPDRQGTGLGRALVVGRARLARTTAASAIGHAVRRRRQPSGRRPVPRRSASRPHASTARDGCLGSARMSTRVRHRPRRRSRTLLAEWGEPRYRAEQVLGRALPATAPARRRHRSPADAARARSATALPLALDVVVAPGLDRRDHDEVAVAAPATAPRSRPSSCSTRRAQRCACRRRPGARWPARSARPARPASNATSTPARSSSRCCARSTPRRSASRTSSTWGWASRSRTTTRSGRRSSGSTPTLGISARHLTISTVGVVPGIRRLAEEALPVTLAVSLHAPDDELRDAAGAAQPPVPDRRGARRRRRRSPRPGAGGSPSSTPASPGSTTLPSRRSPSGGRLAAWPGAGGAHVNLIPLNPTAEFDGAAPPRPRLQGFAGAAPGGRDQRHGAPQSGRRHRRRLRPAPGPRADPPWRSSERAQWCRERTEVPQPVPAADARHRDAAALHRRVLRLHLVRRRSSC